MKIYAICKTLNAGSDNQIELMKNLNINIGDKFLVKDIKIYHWHTEIYLEEFPNNIFNSSFFKFIDEENNDINIFQKKFIINTKK